MKRIITNKIKDFIITLIVFAFDFPIVVIIWHVHCPIPEKILVTIPVLIIGEVIDLFLCDKIKKENK